MHVHSSHGQHRTPLVRQQHIAHMPTPTHSHHMCANPHDTKACTSYDHCVSWSVPHLVLWPCGLAACIACCRAAACNHRKMCELIGRAICGRRTQIVHVMARTRLRARLVARRPGVALLAVLVGAAAVSGFVGGSKHDLGRPRRGDVCGADDELKSEI